MSGPYNIGSPDRALQDVIRDLRRRVRQLEAGGAVRGGVQTRRLTIGRYVVEEGTVDGVPTLIAYPAGDPDAAVDLLALPVVPEAP